MRARGWDPTVARRIAEDRAQGERELAQRLVAEPEYRDRVRDVVSGRYLAFELVNAVKEAIHAHRRVDLVATLTDDIDKARRLTDSMPSADAWISLLTTAHSNPQSCWELSDIFEFDALSVAIPYCDVVVTDRHACSLANAARLPQRLGTKNHPHARPTRLGARRHALTHAESRPPTARNHDHRRPPETVVACEHRRFPVVGACALSVHVRRHWATSSATVSASSEWA